MHNARGANMLRVTIAFAIAALPLAALAQSYRCVGTDGKKYYGSSVPPQCLGRPVEELNAQGMVMKKFDAAASADERAKKDAEDAERKKREAISKEQGRKDNALLASYTSEKDIEQARARALEGVQKATTEVEERIAALKKRRAAPNQDVKTIDIDLKAQEGLLAAKRKEMDTINAKYDDDKKRYIEITKRGK
jgi:chromosome segregation ATPase